MWNENFQMFKLDSENARDSEKNQRLNYQHHWIIEKAREFQKNLYFCFIDYAKAFEYVDENKL